MESNQSNNQDLFNDALIELLTLTCEVNKYGTKCYYNKKGELHRIHGPALIDADGNIYWIKNGKNHREGGPALIRSNGYRVWYKNGKLHREDGPAVIWPSGEEEYWIDNIDLFKEEFIQWQKDNGIKPSE